MAKPKAPKAPACPPHNYVRKGEKDGFITHRCTGCGDEITRPIGRTA